MGNANVSAVKKAAKAKIMRLSNSYEKETGKATLANLRHGAGKFPSENPEALGYVISYLPAEMYGYGDDVSYAEWALYGSLTMYAIHQQGKKKCMYKEGMGFGAAMARLVKSDSDQDRIASHLNKLTRSGDIQSLLAHMRNVITLLNTESVPLDYVDLAGDLYMYQFENSRDRIRFKWSQDFYANIHKNENI